MVSFTFLIFIVSGCHPGAGEGGLLSRSQVLKMNPDSDLVELKDGAVYEYQNGADWIEEKDYEKGEKIGEVKKGMSTKAPIGTEIYKTKEKSPVLILEYNSGISKKYLRQLGE